MTHPLVPERIDLLILARLAGPLARPPAPADVRKSLARLAGKDLPASAWKALFDQRIAALRERGDITPRPPLAVSEAGRARAARALGVAEVPAWRMVRTRLLPALALGLPAGAPAVGRRLSQADGLRASILRARHGLPVAEAPTRNQAIDALVLRHIGIDSDKPLGRHLDTVRRYLLEQILGSKTRLGLDQIYALLAAEAAGAHRREPDALRDALIHEWLTPGLDAIPAFDLAAFARAVQGAADREHGAGRFGERKVFISVLWHALRHTPMCAGMTLETFKRHLVDANREDLLALHRADLVKVMDPVQVEESELIHGNASFHFVDSAPRRQA